MVFGTLAHLRDCPLQYRDLLHIETGKVNSLPHYVVKKILFYFSKEIQMSVLHRVRQKLECALQ